MEKRIAFIGHREIYDMSVYDKLYAVIEQEIINGCTDFTMGSHGMFDSLALAACRELRWKYRNIEIEVVITSLNAIRPTIIKDEIFGDEKIIPYKDVKTVMYDIEDEYFKRQITESNKKMIDTCSTLICYVNKDKKRGGAILALRYAMKKKLRIINLYE